MIWLLTILLAVVSIILLVLWILERRKVKRYVKSIHVLSTSVSSFLTDPVKAKFSLNEDFSAPLQNAVASIEEAYLQLFSLLQTERQRHHQFIADISHQLKTPLAGLKLYVELTKGEHLERELKLIERMEN